MRYESVSNVMRLATRLQGARMGLTIDQIQAEFGVSRRTAERLRDAVEQNFGPLEEAETGERRKRWRLRSNPLRQLVRVAPEELAELESAAEGLERAGLSERAEAIRDVAGKLRALWRPRRDVDAEDELEMLMRTEGLAMRAGPRSRPARMFTANSRTRASATPVVVIMRLVMCCVSCEPPRAASRRPYAALRHSTTTALTNSQNTMRETK